MFRQPKPEVYWVKNVLSGNTMGLWLYKRMYEHTRPKIPIVQEEQLPPECEVIHGHYSPDHFSKTITRARLVTVIRNPLDRTMSHYRFERQLRQQRAGGREVAFMTFEQFAKLPDQQNFQTQHLYGFTLSRFAEVGTTEDLDCYCRKFDPSGRIALARLNTTKGKVEVSASFRKEYERMNFQDYELYEEAKRRAGLV